MCEQTEFRQRCVVLLCTDDPEEERELLRAEIDRASGPAIHVQAVSSPAGFRDAIARMEKESVPVPLVLMDESVEEASGGELLLELQANLRYRATRKVLLTDQSSVEDLTRLLNMGALHTRLTKPISYRDLKESVQRLLTDYFLEQAPEEVEHLFEHLDPRQLSQALVASERLRRDLASQLSVLKRSFLSVTELSDEQVEQEMIRELMDTLGDPQTETIPAGSVMFRENDPVEMIWIIIRGKVHLTRMAGEKEILMHMDSAGRVVGLLALAQRQRALYSCRTATEVTLIPVTLEQLDQALQSSPDLSVYFDTVLIRTLAKRVRRSAELQVEVENLNTALSRERDNLSETIALLKKTQTRLLESEKMATLGLLSAGIAHELNNPIAAILRSADYVAEDIEPLILAQPAGQQLLARLQAARAAKPLATREEREIRHKLTSELEDRLLARRLVSIGIYSKEEYQQHFKGLKQAAVKERLALMERVHQLGTGLRNIHSCADRVTSIVKSLRSYARPDEHAPAFEDLHEGLEDTLLLFGHALKNINIDRNYGELPRVECRAGQLNQVWTNLISNALQAMGGAGTLRLETEALPSGNGVVVRIIDNGPGVPKEVQERIFGMHFTTKQGRVHFGLGMGLSICHRIVTRHGGKISLESKPGRTCFSVTLPVHYPKGGSEEVPGASGMLPAPPSEK